MRGVDGTGSLRSTAAGLASACLLLLFGACGAARVPGLAFWSSPEQRQVDLIFADLAGESVFEEAPQEWDFDVPSNLRPCCAFGYDLKVRLGALPLPGMRVGNLIEPNRIGDHVYNASPLSSGSELVSNLVPDSESNGLVYTCRGGFIDLAHVRDYADWTVYLTGQIEQRLDFGGVLELPDEGGRRFIYVAAPGELLIERVGRRELAVTLAQWLAFQLSVWHETATWYGWSALSAFSEEASAFSPEDIYSNLLGIRIAGEIVRSSSFVTRHQYDRNMSRAIEVVLGRLAALPPSGARHAADSVDGIWWDSSRSLPDRDLVLRRNFDIGPLILPWTVPPELSTAEMRADVETFCHAAGKPVALVVPGLVGGVPISELVRLDVRIASQVAQRMSSARLAEPWMSQSDIADVVAAVRSETGSTPTAVAERRQ